MLVYSVLFISLISLHSASTPKCRGVVFEGGGDKGAFEAGALVGLTKRLGEDAAYDVITGVSMGGMNSLSLSVIPKQDYQNQCSLMLQVWESQDVSSAIQSWPWGVLQGLFEKQGLFDYQLVNYLLTFKQKYPDLVRKVTVGAVNILNGKYALFNQSLGFDRFADALQATSSIPLIFPPMQLEDGQYYIDGGSVYNALPIQAVNECRELGYDDQDIEIDVLMTGTFSPPTTNVTATSILDILHRLYIIRSFYNKMQEVKHSVWEYSEVQWRYLVRPNVDLDTGFIPTGFTQRQIKKQIKLGEEMANEVIDMGPGESFKKFLNLGEKNIGYGGRRGFMKDFVVFV